MKITARAWSADDKEIAPGALKEAARNVPVSVNFDGSNIVGSATIFPDGSAVLDINVPVERTIVKSPDGVLGIGFVVEQDRWEGGVRTIERLRPVTVGISPALVERLLRGKK